MRKLVQTKTTLFTSLYKFFLKLMSSTIFHRMTVIYEIIEYLSHLAPSLDNVQAVIRISFRQQLWIQYHLMENVMDSPFSKSISKCKFSFANLLIYMINTLTCNVFQLLACVLTWVGLNLCVFNINFLSNLSQDKQFAKHRILEFQTLAFLGINNLFTDIFFFLSSFLRILS